MSSLQLLERLEDEVKELTVALASETPSEIIGECVDVANFAAMIAHKMSLEVDLNDMKPRRSPND